MKKLLGHASNLQQEVAKTLIEFTGLNGLYSSVVPDRESTKSILRICEHLGVKATELEEFHSTIMYSPEASVPREVLIRNIGTSVTKAVPIGFDLFGKEKDTLVLTLMSPQMFELHSKWRALGCVPTYPWYRPHVTLTYEASLTEKDLEQATSWVINESGIPLLTFLPEVVEDIKPD